jgi:hypothetical protein
LIPAANLPEREIDLEMLALYLGEYIIQIIPFRFVITHIKYQIACRAKKQFTVVFTKKVLATFRTIQCDQHDDYPVDIDMA